MFRQLIKYCWPYKRQLSWVLIGLGLLLLIVFVPFQIWLALMGCACVVAGIILSKA